VIVVGHQPTLGRVVARLLGNEADLSIQKGALWWIEARDKAGKSGVRVRAVVSPDFA
jgi:phosphohistidine phosphatase